MESINFRNPTLWWHDLRATFGTRLAGAGYESFTIMQLMGHSGLKTAQSATSGQRSSVDGLLWRPKQ